MWRNILGACALVSACIIGLSAVMVSYDVLARNMGLPSFTWIIDMTEYALPLATLLVAPWLALNKGHIRIDLVTLMFSRQALGTLNRITNLACAVLCTVLAWFSISVITESYEMGALVIKNVVFAEWWIYVPLPFCFALLSIEFLRQVFTHDAPVQDSENLEGMS